MVTFLVPTGWLYFTPAATLAVNRAPIKSSSTIQRLERLALSSFSARPVSGSCTHAHWPRSKLSLQRALSNLSQRWMMWECSLQSPRCFQSAGLLQYSSTTFCTECGVSPSTTGNILWKCVNEKIRLIESSGDISNNNLNFPPNSSPDLLAHSTPLKESKATVNTKSFMSKFSL